ncbi:MAG: efflux RND transporter periplasmic adaptor subunit [Vicinamibacteria bacterium]|nr:efflux RND transporter periplasmic adaptor subunit [Vicinamibacteria bacterium]
MNFPRRPSPLLLLTLPLFVMGGCRARSSEAKSMPALKARLVGVEKRDLRRDVSSVGSLFAFDEVAVSSEIEGRVDKVFVDLGDHVAAGQPLVQVSPVELGLARDQQQASLQATRAKLGLVEGADDVPDPKLAAEAKRAAADLDDAESKYRRAKSLFDDGLIPKGTLDEAEAKYHSARAAYDMSLQSVENLRAELRQRKATYALAEKKLADAVIRAPFPGQVKERSVVTGQYLRVQTPVMVIVRVDPLRVRLKVPEKVAGWISIGQAVHVEVEAFPGKTFTGTVARMSPSVDAQTRTLEVEALLKNADGQLKPGFFAKATIASNQVDSALMVPEAAVRYVFGVYKIFTVKENKLHEQEVKLGERSGDDVEILDGLTAKDTVAIAPEGQELREGSPVEPVKQP